RNSARSRRPSQIVGTAGDQSFDVRRDQRRRRPYQPRMFATDAGQRLPDRRVPSLPGVAEAAVMPGDRRDATTQSAAAQLSTDSRLANIVIPVAIVQPGGPLTTNLV